MDSDILTKKEIGLMMKHYVGVGLESSLPFVHSPIRLDAGLLHRVNRFVDVCRPESQYSFLPGTTLVVNLMPSTSLSVNLSLYMECNILVVKVVNTQFHQE